MIRLKMVLFHKIRKLINGQVYKLFIKAPVVSLVLLISTSKIMRVNLLIFVALSVIASTWAQGFVNYDQFRQAVTSNGFPAPSQEKFSNFNRYARSTGSISSKQEAAMALAQFLHESGGLRYVREQACEVSQCPGSYQHNCDVPGRHYYGRGYIQLSWCYNYRDASRDIFGNPQVLLNDPDRVAREDALSWQTAFWFWRVRVRNDVGVQRGQFGSSTGIINSQECVPGNRQKEVRFRIYGNVRRAFGLPGAGNPSGC